MRFRYPVTITVERETTDPRTGDPLPDPARHTIDGCAYAPGERGDRQELGTSAVEGRVLFAPYGADIREIDVIYFPGEEAPWEVDGERGDWRNPFTDWRPGAHVALKRQRGAA